MFTYSIVSNISAFKINVYLPASLAAEVTLGADSPVAVVPWRTGRSAFPALEFQARRARRAVQAGHARRASVQAQRAPGKGKTVRIKNVSYQT